MSELIDEQFSGSIIRRLVALPVSAASRLITLVSGRSVVVRSSESRQRGSYLSLAPSGWKMRYVTETERWWDFSSQKAPTHTTPPKTQHLLRPSHGARSFVFRRENIWMKVITQFRLAIDECYFIGRHLIQPEKSS